ncbi:MAG: hypothetical protein U0704_06950 [Candidatus Eisenbacteria bacterium]
MTSARASFARRVLASTFLLSSLAADIASGFASLTWVNALGGSASTAANWSPAQVPVTGDDIKFALAALYSVGFDAGADSVRNMAFSTGNVTVSIAGQHVATGTLTLTSLAADTVAVRLNSGTLRVKGAVNMGTAGKARYTSANAGTRLVAESNLSAGSSSGAIARINVLDGSRLEVGGMATFATSGACSTAVRGRDPVTHEPAAFTTGTDLLFKNTSRMDVLDSAFVKVGRDMSVGPELTGANAALRVAGGSRVEVGDDLLLYRDNSFNIGTNRTTIETGAVVVVAETTLVSKGLSSQGQLDLLSGGTLDTRAFIVNTNGVVTHQGGNLIIRGGPYRDFTKTNLPNLGGRIELRDGATMTLSSSSGDALSMIGGSLRLTTGANLTITSGPTRFAVFGSGAVDVDSGGVFTTPSDILTGPQNDPARLTVRGGGHVTARNINMASFPNSNLGTVDVVVSGTGSVLTSDIFTIGASFDGGSSGSPATARVDSGGTLAASGLNRFATIGRMGSLQIGPGSTAGPFQAVTLRGLLAMRGGTLSASQTGVFGSDTASVRGFGSVSGRLLATSPGAVLRADGGTLVLGAAADTGGFRWAGLVDAGSAAIQLLDADQAYAHRVAMAGGTLTASNGLRLLAGDTLSGAGTIQGPVTNDGAILASGGLSFGGLLSGAGSCVGDRVTLLSGGGFQGAGDFAAELLANAGSTITATGDLAMGSAGSANGAEVHGTLLVGAHHVTLHDADQVALGNLTRVLGGTLSFTGGQVTAGSGCRLEGFGTLEAGTRTTINGVLAPGDSLGTLVTSGPLLLQGGRLEIQLGDHASAQWDRLSVGGTLDLESAALRVRLAQGFTYGLADTFVVATFASCTGSFATLDLPAVPAPWSVEVVQQANRLLVVVALNPALAGVPGSTLPGELALWASPPASGRTSVRLALPGEADVDLAVFDIGGRRMAQLARQRFAAGEHSFALEHSSLPNGIYFVRATVTHNARAERRVARLVMRR